MYRLFKKELIKQGITNYNTTELIEQKGIDRIKQHRTKQEKRIAQNID